jgi:Domain of unknown function (DUF4112)
MTDYHHLHKDRLERLERLASLMDTRWTLPIVNIGIGWDSIIGMLPIVGDTATSCMSAYIIHQAHLLGVPFGTKARMVLNILIDWCGGSLPFLGDVFDIAWKSNRKNMALVKAHVSKQ